jgi:hypothetical protein
MRGDQSHYGWLTQCNLPAVRTVLILLPALSASCGLQEVPDWETFYSHQPKSILIVPVENETTAAEAPRFFMATVASVLIARGYYVFPVEPTADILASEGFTAGAELESVPPEKLRKFFGADGILYVTIKKWDTSYAVLASAVTVTIQFRLLDTRSGAVVWGGTWTAQRQSGAGGGHPLAALVVMAIDAAMTAALTDYVPLAREANTRAFQTLVPGEYHPEYSSLKERNLSDWHGYQEAKRAEEEEAREAP